MVTEVLYATALCVQPESSQGQIWDPGAYTVPITPPIFGRATYKHLPGGI